MTPLIAQAGDPDSRTATGRVKRPFVGSIAEEVFYRGYLLWAFTPVIGIWVAVLVSSIAFGLAHAYQGRSRIFQTTLIGLVFATGFALSRSLWWLMLGHIMINLNAYFYARKLNRLSLRYNYDTRVQASIEVTAFKAKNTGERSVGSSQSG